MFDFLKKKVPAGDVAKLMYTQCIKPYSPQFLETFTCHGVDEVLLIKELLCLKAFAYVHGVREGISDKNVAMVLVTAFHDLWKQGEMTSTFYGDYAIRFESYNSAFHGADSQERIDKLTDLFCNYLSESDDGKSSLMAPQQEAGLRIQASLFFINCYGAFSQKALDHIRIVGN